MKRILLLIFTIFLVMLVAGCSSHKKHHNVDLPDPQSFNAHFGDMDANGDDLVTWEEFSAHFQNAEQKVFNAIDLNQDGHIDHDEWHEFKEAHGMKHHD
jgi:hypothetical protein